MLPTILSKSIRRVEIRTQQNTAEHSRTQLNAFFSSDVYFLRRDEVTGFSSPYNIASSE